MKLIGNLKEQVEKAETKEAAKEVIKETIEEAGMLLSDDELDMVAGGKSIHIPSVPNVRGVPGNGGIVGHHKEPV